jgi:nucleoside phosphorylase
VVLLGTCGAYVGGLGLAQVAISQRVVLAEPAVARGEAAFPDPMRTEVMATEAMGSGLALHGGALVDIATTLAVTTDDALASVLASSTRCQAEHLEAYAVAAACKEQGIPFAAALGVANVVGSVGREQWRANHHAASKAAVALLLSWIEGGAPGFAAR